MTSLKRSADTTSTTADGDAKKVKGEAPRGSDDGYDSADDDAPLIPAPKADGGDAKCCTTCGLTSEHGADKDHLRLDAIGWDDAVSYTAKLRCGPCFLHAETLSKNIARVMKGAAAAKEKAELERAGWDDATKAAEAAKAAEAKKKRAERTATFARVQADSKKAEAEQAELKQK